VPEDSRPSSPPKPSRLWLWFVAAFLLQAVAWAAWLFIASRNRVEDVPLTTGQHRVEHPRALTLAHDGARVN